MFWDLKEILGIDYIEKGHSITGSSYANAQRKFKKAIKKKFRAKLTAAGVLLLHDNAPVHIGRVAKAAVRVCEFEEINYSPYSPELAPNDYFPFSNLKEDYPEKRFSKDDEVKAANNAHFSDKEKIIF